MKTPTLIVDDFYEDVQSVRDFALSQDFDISNETFPGSRTKGIHEIDNTFFHYCSNKVLALLFPFTGELTYKVDTRFQLIQPYEDSVSNRGWIHSDPDLITAIVYLTPNADPNSGTSIFHTTEKYNEEEFGNLSDARKLLYSDDKKDFDAKQYKKMYDEHLPMFKETVRVDNVYNRILVFDSKEWHGVPRLDTSSDPRLTQIFFFKEIKTNQALPVIRSNNVKWEAYKAQKLINELHESGVDF